MLNRLLDLLAPKATPATGNEPQRVRVATCVLLLEIAHADKSFSDEECARIQEALRQRFGLSSDEVQELMEMADEARQDSHDLWRFTNRINQACSPEEKREIIREVWRIVYADGELSSHEDHLIHKMASLLNLTHPQLIAEKMEALKEFRGGT